MINVAGIIHEDGANGPGLRCTIFVQGCKRRCKECHSQHTWEFGTGKDMSADELADEILKNPLDTGVTISGGDPVYQYAEVLNALILVKQKLRESKRSFNFMLYTGADSNELYKWFYTKERFDLFITMFDYIKAGSFDNTKVDGTVKWAGSSNQKVYTPEIDDTNDSLILTDITNTF